MALIVTNGPTKWLRFLQMAQPNGFDIYNLYSRLIVEPPFGLVSTLSE